TSRCTGQGQLGERQVARRRFSPKNPGGGDGAGSPEAVCRTSDASVSAVAMAAPPGDGRRRPIAGLSPRRALPSGPRILALEHTPRTRRLPSPARVAPLPWPPCTRTSVVAAGFQPSPGNVFEANQFEVFPAQPLRGGFARLLLAELLGEP